MNIFLQVRSECKLSKTLNYLNSHERKRTFVGIYPELSLLKFLRYLQAVADRWLQALFESIATLRHLLSQVCASAQRVIAKASRKRRTSAQRLRESLESQNEFIKLTIKPAA